MLDRKAIINGLNRPGMYAGEQGDRSDNEWFADAIIKNITHDARSNITEIILCSACNGKGLIDHAELEDYHRGTYREWTLCKRCSGTGRFERWTVTFVQETPYETPTE